MGWLALSIVFFACAVMHGLMQIAKAIDEVHVYHHIGRITISEEKARIPTHDDQFHVRQTI